MKIKLSIAGIIILLIFAYFISAAQISEEPITKDGGVSAGWVLTGAFLVIGSLITFIIYDMKRQFTSAMGSVIRQLEKIEVDLNQHSVLHGRYEEKFRTLFNELKN